MRLSVCAPNTADLHALGFKDQSKSRPCVCTQQTQQWGKLPDWQTPRSNTSQGRRAYMASATLWACLLLLLFPTRLEGASREYGRWQQVPAVETSCYILSHSSYHGTLWLPWRSHPSCISLHVLLLRQRTYGRGWATARASGGALIATSSPSSTRAERQAVRQPK